jgi:hypothetical protein
MTTLKLPLYQVQHVLLQHCPPLRFASPWDFLSADEGCRYPVTNPREVLGALARKYHIGVLDSARVIDRGSSGELRLRPALSNPAGAIIGLRQAPGVWPHDLLTARGDLGSDPCTLSSALADSQTAAAVKETRVLFLPFRIGEVAWLRSLGLSATLCPPIHRFTPEQLGAFDTAFKEDFGELGPKIQEARATRPTSDQNRPSPPSGVVGPRPTAAGPPPPKPTLALLGWAPLTLTSQFNPALTRLAAYLLGIQRHLCLEFSGLAVWRPPPSVLENLRFRLKWRNAELIRELLLESTEELSNWEPYGAPAQTGNQDTVSEDFATVQDQLLAELAGSRGRDPSLQLQRVQNRYEEAVRRDLVAPLQTWALANPDPVIRNAGVELARTFHLLHAMSPLLQDIQRRHLQGSLTGELEALPPRMFDQYLKLGTRLGSLMRDITQWQRI